MDNDKKDILKIDNQSNSDNHNPDSAGVLSRRFFLSRSLASAGTFLLASGIAGGSPTLAKEIYKRSIPDTSSLKSKFNFKGEIFAPSNPEFKNAAYAGLWNKLSPARVPQVIVRVADEQDVVAAVNFARENKLKVCVRGGGHNWCNPSLRNSGVMIDLTNLNKVISVDAANHKAVVQPIISNRDIQKHLNAQGLSFPSGHCPQVKLSGYLLSGGMSWNQGEWGPGVGSVEAIEMVTPEGKMITASAHDNQDYFWAARGAGCGLFAVAVRYHLKLYPLPKAIHASSYYYPYEDTIEVAKWIGPLAAKLPPKVELSIWILNAPKELSDKCKSSNGKVCLVTASIFANSAEEAKDAVKLLDTCPVIDRCLSKTVAEPTNFERLFDASGALWQANLRNNVDALYSDEGPADLLKAVQNHFLKCPSPKSIIMFALFTGPNVPAPLLDTCFSMSARVYGGPWTMWDKVEDDKANIAWHHQTVQLLGPHLSGHYVSETDTISHPEYLKASFKPANFKRLAELRKKYDPEGVFFDFSEGLT